MCLTVSRKCGDYLIILTDCRVSVDQIKQMSMPSLLPHAFQSFLILDISVRILLNSIYKMYHELHTNSHSMLAMFIVVEH